VLRRSSAVTARVGSVLLTMALAACGDEGAGPGPGGPGDRLQGAAGDPAAPAIPTKPFVPRAADYSDTHPELPGIQISFNTLLVVFDPAATVGEVNAALDALGAEIVGGVPGMAGAAGGVLMLRVPTQSHAEMEALLASLRDGPKVQHAVQDALLTPTVISRPNGGAPTWLWELAAAGGNWGLEASRVPQLWNLNAAVRKATGAATVGVVDAGFATTHEDLRYDANATPGAQDNHGTHVAGTIAAVVDNGTGVDGVNPFARLVVWGSSTTSFAAVLSAVDSLVRARPDIRVINMSLAYNWGSAQPAAISTATNAAARRIANQEGAVLLNILRGLAASGIPLPVIIAAAGNDSNDGVGDQEAKHASPMNSAALEQGAAPIIVVESDSLPNPGTFDIRRSDFSNLNGHVSAPGSQILSTVLGGTYGIQSGTSMASPLVSGVVSYLYALDPTFPRPTLTTNPIRDLLVATAVPVRAGAQPRVDAFAAALQMDVAQGGTKVLRRLIDVDDGTPDGNLRLAADGSVFTAEDADGDGGEGDGDVDMSDFRRWRDWLLQLENPAGLALDGAVDHPKRDLNGGGINVTDGENIYPRGDFNGDGLLHRSITRAVPGALANAALSDLQVIQQLFSDPDYPAADLPGLIDSGDLEVNPARCLALSGVASVRSSIRVKGTPANTPSQPPRTHTTASPVRVYTAAVDPAGYTARVEALDGAGTVLGFAEQDFSLALGGDEHFDPTCGTLDVNVVFPTTVTPGTPTALDVQVGIRDPATGVVTPAANVQIDIVPAGGTVSPASGLTDGQGRFTASATLAPGNTVLTLLITATASTGASTTVTVTAQGSVPAGSVTLEGRQGEVTAEALAQTRSSLPIGFQSDRKTFPPGDVSPFSMTAKADATKTSEHGTAEAHALSTENSSFSFTDDGQLTGGNATATLHSEVKFQPGEVEGDPRVRAQAFTNYEAHLKITGAPRRIQLTMSASSAASTGELRFFRESPIGAGIFDLQGASVSATRDTVLGPGTYTLHAATRAPLEITGAGNVVTDGQFNVQFTLSPATAAQASSSKLTPRATAHPRGAPAGRGTTRPPAPASRERSAAP
jgi:hypothetical protein